MAWFRAYKEVTALFFSIGFMTGGIMSVIIVNAYFNQMPSTLTTQKIEFKEKYSGKNRNSTYKPTVETPVPTTETEQINNQGKNIYIWNVLLTL